MAMQSVLKIWAICVLVTVLIKDVDLEVPRPRGVPIEKASLYGSGVDFACFDGSAVIPFDQVNDDYCDCPDGSDEPGTSACSKGTFHCINAGHTPLDIPSSRVNDGICDCCDGSDEYQSPVACENTCMELGRAAREEAERKAKLAAEGHQIYLEYSKQGKDAKAENQARLEVLRQSKDELQAVRDDLEAKKNEAEEPEKVAKDAHQAAYDEEKAKRKAAKEEETLVAAFADLDENKDDVLTIAEMQQRDEFDIDANGEVSEEEAKEHLEDNESVDLGTFRSNVWPNIKEIYQAPAAPPAEDGDTPPSDEPPQQEQVEEEERNHLLDDLEEDGGEEYGDDEEYGEDDDYVDDLEDDDFRDDFRDEKGDDGADDSDDFPMPPYDAETQALVDAADVAREAFKEADTKLEDTKREERELQSMLDTDYGNDMQFYPLKGTCHEYTEREYVYKFCPFERATQRQKYGGGPETSLGVWGRWDGPGDELYSVMLLERGQGCWNGPDRSVRVLIECGVTHEVFAASEPNRCEYQFQFRTPAACSQARPAGMPNPHEEL